MLPARQVQAMSHKKIEQLFGGRIIREISSGVYLLDIENRKYIVKERDHSAYQCAQSRYLFSNYPLHDPEGFINKPLQSVDDGEHYYTLEYYIEGNNDPEYLRRQITSVFSALGKFHLKNKITGRVWSLYSDGNVFSSIEEMLTYEFDYHEQFFSFKDKLDLCRNTIINLNSGFQTIVHGDINYGNIVFRDDTPVLIDTEFAASSLNLFEFEHVDMFGIDRDYPEKIIDPGGTCYTAYFDSIGVNEKEGIEMIRTYNILKVMRQNTYDVYFHHDDKLETVPVLIDTILQYPSGGSGAAKGAV